jgi:hypothetical protein
MSKLLSFLAGVFKDVNGTPSSKRVIAFLLLTSHFIQMIAVYFFHAQFQPTIWSDTNWGLLLFGGMATSEMFTSRKPI